MKAADERFAEDENRKLFFSKGGDSDGQVKKVFDKV